MTRASTSSAVLIGRDTESRALIARVDAARSGSGGALLVRGAPGIGKTSLLETARAHASATGFLVLSTTGVQSETHIPFAGLHQLLGPVLQSIDLLPVSYGNALRSAFGVIEEQVVSPHLVAMAMLQLLVETAERAPLLLLVDDAQWVDASTARAIAFVGRRLDSDPIVLMAVLRDGFESPIVDAGLQELTIDALMDEHARALLDSNSPRLDPGDRDQILRSAAGNPLGLVELSRAFRSRAHAARMLSASDVPLTTRLEHAFADRLASMAPGTRSFLRVAASDERGLLAEVLAATSVLEGREIMVDAATEAKAAALIDLEGPELRFRHPLIRSAIYQAMTLEQRQGVHRVLAATLEADPDRRVWHRAAATVGKDDELAAELEAAAGRSHARGATDAAFEALQRASQLGNDPARRTRLLIEAVHLAIALGRANDVSRLLDELGKQSLGPLDQPRVAFLKEATRGLYTGASWIGPYAEVADQMRAAGDVDRGLTTLTHIGLRCWWSHPDARTRARLVDVAERFPVSEDRVDRLYVLALAAPIERGADVLPRISRCWARGPANMGEAQRLGVAALALGDFAIAEGALDSLNRDLRTHGVLGVLSNMLTLQAWTKIQLGDWKQAGSLATEAARLARETGQGRPWPTFADLAAATVLAYRGEVVEAEALAAEGERVLFSCGRHPMLALVQYARGVAALAAGRHDEAFQQLRRIFNPADSTYHPPVQSWVLVDLVEAAAHSEHEHEAAEIVEELEPIAARTQAPLMLSALQFARAVLSSNGDEAAFHADLANWPFIRARLQLAHGVSLRRQRRSADSRAPLRAARDAFDALGAVPWGERARQELRASGETSRRRSYDLADALSPQEFQIAQLAAAGLSNKEIGVQLFLSHRTVGSHLYRVFPKLGITARSHLSAALKERSTSTS